MVFLQYEFVVNVEATFTPTNTKRFRYTVEIVLSWPLMTLFCRIIIGDDFVDRKRLFSVTGDNYVVVWSLYIRSVSSLCTWPVRANVCV